MKLDNKVKFVGLAVVVLFIVALIMGCVIGINKDLMYQSHEQISIVIGKDFEISDVKKITDEVFKDKYVVLRKVEVFKDSVAIDIDYSTEEELEALKNKMNEVYGLSLESITAEQIPAIRIMDIITPYIVPSIISIVVLLVYVGIKYRKIDKKAVVREPLFLLVSVLAALLAYYSLVVICRIPFSKSIVSISAIVAFIISIVWVDSAEKRLNKAIEEEK